MKFIPKSILVTGGCGFIASHVVDSLKTHYGKAITLTIIDRMDHGSSSSYMADFQKECTKDDIQIVKGDIKCLDLLCHIIEKRAIDTVMHFAAQTHVDHSFHRGFDFTMDNVYGTHVLLEACRKNAHQIKRIIHVSTDEVYGPSKPFENTEHAHHESNGSNGSNESSTLNPTNPYAASKVGAEMLCLSYIKSYKLPIIITRGNNVYGPRQFPDKLIPRFIVFAMQGKKLPIHGKGDTFRSFLYVEDVASAFLTILEKGILGEIYNIGTHDEMRVYDVAYHILFSLHQIQQEKDVQYHIEFIKDREFNDLRYHIDSQKLLKLGWKGQTVSWELGLQKTIQWYQTHYHPGKKRVTHDEKK